MAEPANRSRIFDVSFSCRLLIEAKTLPASRYRDHLSEGRATRAPLVYCRVQLRTFAAPTVFVRDAVAAGSTTNVTWAGPLAGQALSAIYFLRADARSGVELLAPALREAAIGTRVPIEIANAMSVGWVGQGGAKPLSSGAFDVAELLVLQAHRPHRADHRLATYVERRGRGSRDLAGLLARMQDRSFSPLTWSQARVPQES